jgi:hypothetical protein
MNLVYTGIDSVSIYLWTSGAKYYSVQRKIVLAYVSKSVILEPNIIAECPFMSQQTILTVILGRPIPFSQALAISREF